MFSSKETIVFYILQIAEAVKELLWRDLSIAVGHVGIGIPVAVSGYAAHIDVERHRTRRERLGTEGDILLSRELLYAEWGEAVVGTLTLACWADALQ